MLRSLNYPLSNKGFVQDFQNTKSDRKSMFKNMTLNVGDRLERKD